MKVIFISKDAKISEPSSAVARRFEEYRKIFDKLHVVVLKGNIFEAYKNAKRLIHNSKFIVHDLVVSTQDPFETGIIGVFLKLFHGVSLQIQLHTDFNNKYFLLSSPLNFIRFLLAHLTLPFADSVRTVSKRSAESIRDLNKNISVLPIYTEARNPKHEIRKDTDKIIILTVARLEKEKDIGTAIKAFAKVVENNPKTEFVIVGEGSERRELEEVARNLGLGTRVKFVGWQTEGLARFYEGADIYISTSLFEGYGMAMIEAAAARMPLVVSDAGIAGEVFQREESAIICKPKDVNCFASALERLLNNGNLRLRMGETARSAALSHQISREEYLAAFKMGMESAVVNFQKRNFVGRMIEFVKSVFQGNKILRFILAGGTAAFTQIAVLYLFTDIFGIWYLYSSVLSFVIALFISFTLQKFWAFRDRTMARAHIQFIKYALIISADLLFNTVLMFFLVDILHFWYIMAQIITGALIAVVNFLSYRKFIFA